MNYVKVPIELCQFALTERKTTQVGVYLAGQLAYPGKVRISDNPVKKIASLCSSSGPTVFRSIDWLLSRNWMGKDSKNGWYFFRGLNRVHRDEEWQYNRAVIIQAQDLQKIKSFFISAVISSAIKTGNKREGGSERPSSRSMPNRFPVPVSFLQKTLNVSRRTAIRYFKMAKQSGFIDVIPNLQPVISLSAPDVKHMRLRNIASVQVQLLGTSDFKHVNVDHLRIDKGKVFLQGVNLICSHLLLGKRRKQHLVPQTN